MTTTKRKFSVALIGCDGAGKTTVARALERRPDLQIRYLYMGVSPDSSNRQLPTTKLAHALKRRRGAPPDTAGPREHPPGPLPPASLPKRVRRSMRSTLRTTNRVAEEWYRQLLASTYRRRGEIVLFDRHFVADFHAADVAGQHRTLARRVHGLLLQHVYPKPDLVIFLDAPPEVLFARKGEGTIASLARRRREYLQLAESTDNFAVVEATQPLDDVVGEVTRIVQDFEVARA
jgi:thymidylate kinase